MTESPTGAHLTDANNIQRQLQLAQTGKGSEYMETKTGLAFANYTLNAGFGVSIMEGYGHCLSEGKHAIYHQILDIDDDGENWKDHRNPAFALALVKIKFQSASEDGVSMFYKFWIELPEKHSFD